MESETLTFKFLCRSSCFRFPFSIIETAFCRSSFPFVFQAISLQPMERLARAANFGLLAVKPHRVLFEAGSFLKEKLGMELSVNILK